jgi:GrpB-like predicted nucleotidyltransferase (UPF0157 family)
MNPLVARRVVEVVDYNPAWPDHFRELRDLLWPSVCDVAVGIEHVGSTAVVGLAAKPIIDLDVVIPSQVDLPLIVTRLARLGYEHRGNLGIEDREAFWTSDDRPPHNLYVCSLGSVALRNHLALRDHLRASPSDVLTYSDLKKDLAQRYAFDIDRYIQGKTDFILSILAQYGFSADLLQSIRNANDT